MPLLSAERQDGVRRVVATAPAFVVLADGTVFAVEKGERRRVLSFRPGVARVGRPDIKDGAWFHGSHKLKAVHLESEDEEPLELYGDGFELTHWQARSVPKLELDSMEPSLPYLWAVRSIGDGAVTEAHYQMWRGPGRERDAFAFREIRVCDAGYVPESQRLRPTPRLRPALFAEPY